MSEAWEGENRGAKPQLLTWLMEDTPHGCVRRGGGQVREKEELTIDMIKKLTVHILVHQFLSLKPDWT